MAGYSISTYSFFHLSIYLFVYIIVPRVSKYPNIGVRGPYKGDIGRHEAVSPNIGVLTKGV